jgi:hypothetical protein
MRKKNTLKGRGKLQKHAPRMMKLRECQPKKRKLTEWLDRSSKQQVPREISFQQGLPLGRTKQHTKRKSMERRESSRKRERDRSEGQKDLQGEEHWKAAAITWWGCMRPRIQDRPRQAKHPHMSATEERQRANKEAHSHPSARRPPNNGR